MCVACTHLSSYCPFRTLVHTCKHPPQPMLQRGEEQTETHTVTVCVCTYNVLCRTSSTYSPFENASIAASHIGSIVGRMKKLYEKSLFRIWQELGVMSADRNAHNCTLFLHIN